MIAEPDSTSDLSDRLKPVRRVRNSRNLEGALIHHDTTTLSDGTSGPTDISFFLRFTGRGRRLCLLPRDRRQVWSHFYKALLLLKSELKRSDRSFINGGRRGLSSVGGPGRSGSFLRGRRVSGVHVNEWFRTLRFGSYLPTSWYDLTGNLGLLWYTFKFGPPRPLNLPTPNRRRCLG